MMPVSSWGLLCRRLERLWEYKDGINRSVDEVNIYISDALCSTTGSEIGACASNLFSTYSIQHTFQMLIRLSALVTSQEMGMIWWSNACLVAMAALALIVTCISYTVFSEVVLRRSTVRRCLSYTMYDIGLVIHNILMIYGRAMKTVNVYWW